MTREQLELAKQIGGLLFGGALHRGLAFEEGIGRRAREGGRTFDWRENENPDANIGAAVELAERMKSKPLNFQVSIDNALHNYGFDTPENHEALIRQSEEEHAQALKKYLDMKDENGNPRYPEDRAAKLGIKNEERLIKWWNDDVPRIPLTPTSSCVSRARIGPNGDIYVTFRSNPAKEYQYEGSADPVEASRVLAQLITSDSIGRDINSWTGHWGKNHTYLPKG